MFGADWDTHIHTQTDMVGSRDACAMVIDEKMYMFSYQIPPINGLGLGHQQKDLIAFAVGWAFLRPKKQQILGSFKHRMTKGRKTNLMIVSLWGRWGDRGEGVLSSS